MTPDGRARLVAGVREYTWVLVGTASAVLGGFVGVRILTEFVAPEAFGEMSLGLTLSTAVNQAAFGPLSSGLARFFMAAKEVDDERRFWTVAWKLVLRWGALALALSVLAPAGLALFGIDIPLGAYGLSLLFAVVAGVHTVLSALQTAARQRAAAALHQLGFHLGRYATAVALVLAVAREAWVALLGFSIGTALVALSEVIMLRPRAAPSAPQQAPRDDTAAKTPTDWEAKVTGYSLPMVGWGVFALLQASADRWSLGLFDSAATVGIYAIVYQLGFYPVGLVVGTVNQFVAPILIQRAGDGSDPSRMREVLRTNDRILLAVTACLGLGIALGWLLSAPLFDLLAAERYRAGAPWLPLALLAASLHGVGQFLSNQWMLGHDTKILFWPKVLTSLGGAGLFFTFNAIAPGVGSTLWASVASGALHLLVLVALRVYGPRH